MVDANENSFIEQAAFNLEAIMLIINKKHPYQKDKRGK